MGAFDAVRYTLLSHAQGLIRSLKDVSFRVTLVPSLISHLGDVSLDIASLQQTPVMYCMCLNERSCIMPCVSAPTIQAANINLGTELQHQGYNKSTHCYQANDTFDQVMFKTCTTCSSRNRLLVATYHDSAGQPGISCQRESGRLPPPARHQQHRPSE